MPFRDFSGNQEQAHINDCTPTCYPAHQRGKISQKMFLPTRLTTVFCCLESASKNPDSFFELAVTNLRLHPQLLNSL